MLETLRDSWDISENLLLTLVLMVECQLQLPHCDSREQTSLVWLCCSPSLPPTPMRWPVSSAFTSLVVLSYLSAFPKLFCTIEKALHGPEGHFWEAFSQSKWEPSGLGSGFFKQCISILLYFVIIDFCLMHSCEGVLRFGRKKVTEIIHTN